MTCVRVMVRLAAAAVALGAATPAFAQDESQNAAGPPLPRDTYVGIPSSSPTNKDCAKKACIYLVNLSGYRVTEFRYAAVTDKKGRLVWSDNQFARDYDFYSKRWTMWYPPKELGCELHLEVVMKIDGKTKRESGTFDTCANPTLLFYIRDPREKVGTVTVDPNPGDLPAKP
jgi:hypothetical protein